ncbi:SCO3374 family protein [Streptomyces sp. NPDC085927]|uniref:SCO3374 family protein n=1 Tax=Streptomyces sp. NPDC085927 TaxID=3365738 RepID=UPI0037D5EAC9
MAGTVPSVTAGLSVPAHRSVGTADGVPGLHGPLGPLGPPGADAPGAPDDPVRHWYENEQGWPTVPGSPVRLPVGVRFDVLDVPAEAGRAALGRPERPGRPVSAECSNGPRRAGSAAGRFPVALQGGRMLLLVAAGSAEELPGLLAWLEWGTLTLDLAAIGTGGLIDAPPPPAAAGHGAVRPLSPGGVGSQGAAVWLRPPEPGREVEASLPALSATRARGDAPDLVRLVNTVATQCHRLRLLRACDRPPAGVREAGRADGQPLACS